MEGYFAQKVAKSTATLTNNNIEQIDLTLKLSPFGQNAEQEEEEKWLTRSSSSSMANGTNEGPFVVPSWQERSCSLPGEGGGVMRFGELQTMRRVRTGKKLLLEKQWRIRAAAAAAAAAAEAMKSPAAVSPPLPPPAGSGRSSLVHAINNFNMLVDSCHDDEGGEVSSDIKTSPMQESMITPKAMQKEVNIKVENPAKKLKTMNPNCVKSDDSVDILRQMPNVTTTGDGPNGKRIEGLLYKYREGQVCIVCVCHGRFLSPAEFVMHAGGREVVNPMKHITVCSN